MVKIMARLILIRLLELEMRRRNGDTRDTREGKEWIWSADQNRKNRSSTIYVVKQEDKPLKHIILYVYVLTNLCVVRLL